MKLSKFFKKFLGRQKLQYLSKSLKPMFLSPPLYTTFSGRQPFLEGTLQWKTTFGGRRPLVEDGLWWKTTFGGRQPSVEDDLLWKTTFSGRRTSVEDDLWWKTTFGGRHLRWKTTLCGRRSSVEDDLHWILACCLLPFVALFPAEVYSFFYMKTNEPF